MADVVVVEEEDSVVIPKLRLWNTEQKFDALVFALSNIEGKFFALQTKNNILLVLHGKGSSEKQLLQDTKEFVWSIGEWECPLSTPTSNSYLVALDLENNVTILEFRAEANGAFQYSIVTIIGCSVVSTVEDLQSINDISLICSLVNNDGTIHRVICLVNKKCVVEILISATLEPKIGRHMTICKEECLVSQQINSVKKKRHFIYLLSDNLVIFVFSLKTFELVLTVNLQERLLLYDVHLFDIIHKNAIPTIVLLDESKQLHFIKLQEFNNTRNTLTSANNKFPSIWKYRLGNVNMKHKSKLTDRSFKDLQLSDTYTVPFEVQMNDFKVTELCANLDTILILAESKAHENESKYLLRYSIIKNTFKYHDVSIDTHLCLSISPLFPTLLVSNQAISIPLFETSQEQLIDHVIQFSDISQAELICKSNNWNQFSIPLHTLQVGLQHRQLETIAFFLKSREKVFTRYWKSMLEMSLTMSMSSSPSKSSFSSQKSYAEIDSDEMVDAIEMLMKAINWCSIGKHKQSFFEELVQLVIGYLNGLIQDGIAALQLKSTTDNSEYMYSRSRCKSKTSNDKSFHFLHDIPDGLKYISEKIIELRSYFTSASSSSPVAQQPSPEVTEIVTTHVPQMNTLQMEDLEEMLLSGNIASLQKTLYSRRGLHDGNLSELMQFGLNVVEGQLRKKNIANAEKMLLNIGLSPDEEIKKIYIRTLEKDLRRHLHVHLLEKRDLLTHQNTVDYTYTEEIESIYTSENFTLVVENQTYTWNSKFEDEVLIKEPNTYSQLSLEHVSHWDESTRRKILIEGRFIKDAIDSIKNDDSQHLWQFLLRRNNLSMLLSWLTSASTKDSDQTTDIDFPELPEIMLTSDDNLPVYTRESILNALVREGFYPEFLIADMGLLLNYLCRNNVLFQDKHPFEHYKRSVDCDERNRLTEEFNKMFLCFCEEKDLVFLLWKFIAHYNIEYDVLSPPMKNWISFLVSIYKMFNRKKESKSLYEALIQNAQMLDAPVATAEFSSGLNGILQNRDGITALSIAIVCDLSIDDILPKDDQPTHLYGMEKALLQDTLRMYPKVYSAIFSRDMGADNAEEDISIYRLLQDNTKLDIRHWFGWQPSNELIIKDESTMVELPHFSNEFLVQRYALDVKLTYDYYLQQGRPMFAYLVYMKECVSSTGMNDLDKDSIHNVTYKLAVENFTSPSITSSCILFMSMLHGPSDVLKVDIRTALIVCKYWNRRGTNEKKYTADEMKVLIVESFTNKSRDKLLHILRLLEESLEIAIHQNKDIKRFSFEAVCHWELAVRFCQAHNLPLTTAYVIACCRENDWLQLILFIHLYQMPQDQVLDLMENHVTEKSLMEHLTAIVKKTKEVTFQKYAKIASSKIAPKDSVVKPVDAPLAVKANERKRDVRTTFYHRIGAGALAKESNEAPSNNDQPATSTPKKMDEENEEGGNKNELLPAADVMDDDAKLPEIDKIPNSIIDILLECTVHPAPWKKLLAYAVTLYHPFLAVLAACYKNSDHSECLCIWYICSVSDDLKLKICQNLIDTHDEDAMLILRSRKWFAEDLLVVMKSILNEGVKYTKLLTQGFVIFKKKDPLVILPQFLEAFLYDFEKSRTLSLLTEFQNDYQAYRDPNVVAKSFATERDLYMCEEFSLQCLMTVLKQCKTTYHAYKFVTYLADAKYGFMFYKEVPNFLLVKDTAAIVYPTGIQFSIQDLCVTDVEEFDRQIRCVFDKLLHHAYFDEACLFAKLHYLSQSHIDIKKCQYELKRISETDSWTDLVVRSTFWNRADESFKRNKCNPELVAVFFELQSVVEDSVLLFSERAKLLLLAIRWYKEKHDGINFEKVYQWERNVWMYRIKAVKENKSATDDLLKKSLLEMSMNDTFSAYHVPLERKCSDVTIVKNIPVTELLQNEDVFCSSSNDVEKFQFSDKEEEEAFELLIASLLDEIHITEARRVASYFKRSTADLEIIITSILLAQGQLPVDRCSDTIKSILAETTSRHISVSGILERSGSFTKPESLTRNITGTSSDMMVDFVFIEEIQNALEKLTLRVNHGKRCSQQILICFKIANILSTSYDEIVTDDCLNVLKRILETRFDHRRQLSKQFIKAFDLPSKEVSLFLGEMIISWIKVIAGVDELNIEQATLMSIDAEKPPKEEDIISLVQLADNSAEIGRMVLQEAIDLTNELANSAKSNVSKLGYEVELLTYAHYCFTITCDMEGIAAVLRTAQFCTKCLTKAKQYSLMVRLLTGIGRFREMFYVVETLYNQHHFEVLCRKGKGNAKENQLKMALLEFMKKYHPDDIENINMISLGFGMYREAAQHLEAKARIEVERIKANLASGGVKELSIALDEIRKMFSYAADNYSKDECYQMKQACTRLAHLTKLQIQLLPTGRQVFGLTTEEVQEFLNDNQDFIESLIVADCYDMREPSIWTEPLYRLVVVKGNFNYLEQYQNFFSLSPSLVTQIALKFRSDKSNQPSPSNMKKVLMRVRDARAKMKIARELKFADVERQIMDGPSGTFLRDHTF